MRQSQAPGEARREPRQKLVLCRQLRSLIDSIITFDARLTRSYRVNLSEP